MDDPLKILLIEDDFEIGKWTKSKLVSFLKVKSLDWATNLSDAFVFLNKETPDLLVLDLKLPDGSGMEILKKIKEENLPIQVFVFSINAGLKQTCLRMGANAFIDKSQESEKLLSIISENLGE